MGARDMTQRVSQTLPESGRRILVMEDHQDTLTSLCLWLEGSGFEVVGAVSAADAAGQFASQTFEVAILAMGVCDLAGYELARRFRATAQTELMLIALTSWGSPQDRATAIEAGFNHLFVKPVDFSALERVIIPRMQQGSR